MKYILTSLMLPVYVCLNIMADVYTSPNVTVDSISTTQQVQERCDSLNVIINKANAGDAIAMNEVGSWYYNGIHVQQDYNAAYEWWKNAALKSDIHAIANLGMCYELGHGVERDSVDAMRLYKKSIKDGNRLLFAQRAENAPNSPFDAMLIGECYEHAIGVGYDYDKAAEYYVMAANKGSIDGMRQAGICLLNANRNRDAFMCFELGAQNGDLSSQYWAGKMLLGGMGIPPDNQQAVIYLVNAAEAGMPAAQNEMGELCADGNVLTKNMQQAAEWYKRASIQGYANGMWNYGNVLRLGAGVKADYDLALMWMAQASPWGYQRTFNDLVSRLDDTGDPFAYYVKGMRLYLVEDNMTAANDYFKKLEKANIPEGKIMQAVILANNSNAKANPEKAVKILESMSHDPEALFYLATLYENGNGVTRDMEVAIDLYRASSEMGYGRAMCHLADIYYEGRGVDKDLESAVSLYRLALDNNQLNMEGATRLAECYDLGFGGLDIDHRRAKELRKYKASGTIYSLLKEMK